jgi:hypothetical protein
MNYKILADLVVVAPSALDSVSFIRGFDRGEIQAGQVFAGPFLGSCQTSWAYLYNLTEYPGYGYVDGIDICPRYVEILLKYRRVKLSLRWNRHIIAKAACRA